MLPERSRSARAARARHVAAGRAAERRARRYYRLRGYRVLDANARAGRYELDLVVRRGSHLVFCEVKMRSSLDFGAPVDMVGREKRRRLRLAAEAWLARHPELDDVDVSFEVIGICGRRLERLHVTF